MKKLYSLFFVLACALRVLANAPAGVEMVDLGLSVKWANMNVGATAPEEYGHYFAWGETQGYTSNYKDGRSFDIASYKWCNGSDDTMTKYCIESCYGNNGFTDGKTTLDAEDDAATANWGAGWRMPTDAEWTELRTSCTWTWTQVNGVNGIRVSATNGNSIFLPAAGNRNDTDLIDAGVLGGYWSASLDSGNSLLAYEVYFTNGLDRGSCYRVVGQSVRPVRQSTNSYTITFVNYDGTTLQSTEVAEGTTPSYNGTTPTKPEDATYTYEFAGWTPSIVAVTAAATYTATFTATAKPSSPDMGEAPDGVEMVDLGLPSGIKWANMNVGATSPEEYGLYFAWGETQGYTGNTNDGHSFNWASYKWCNGSYDSMTKYCTNSSYGTVDGKTTLDPEDDAAHVNWGGSWRMPTESEQQELVNNCTVTWTSNYNGTGVAGRIFTSKSNGNSIFLPAAGDRDYTRYSAGSNGYYWSSSLYESGSYRAWILNVNSGSVYTYYGNRYYGQSVRAVCPAPAPTTYTITFVGANGEELQSSEVAEGEMPVYTGATPTKSEDANYTYEFAGWSPAIVAATAEATYTAQFTATQKVTQGLPAGVEMVDLGLPSGIKWANMNVGASSPEEYGLYFAWGETQGYTGNTNDGRSFDWASYKYCSNGSWTGMTKYTYADGQTDGIWYNNGNFVGDNKTTLDPEDDAAHVNWGGSWRMPTKAEQDELRNSCTWTWTSLNGVNGYRVTGTNGNSIFLPAAGGRYDANFLGAGSYGYYWSSTLSENYSYSSYRLYFNSSRYVWLNGDRVYGLSVRAVCPSSTNPEPEPCLLASGTCGAEGDNLTWELSCDSVLTISGTGAMADWSSTSSPWYSFKNAIRKVIINEGVTSIGKYAFYYCSNLTSVTIPSSVTSIGTSAFLGCTGLTAVSATDLAAWCGIEFAGSSSNPLYYAKHLFVNGVEIVELVIPESVTSIGQYAFYGCSTFSSITCDVATPPTCGSNSFYNVDKTIPLYVPCESVESYVAATGWHDFTNIQPISESCNCLFASGTCGANGDNLTWELSCDGVLTISGTDAMADWSSTSFPWHSVMSAIKEVIINEGVTSIGNYAFYGSSKLSSVTIPKSVTSIGTSAFFNCSGLTAVNITDLAAWCGVEIAAYTSNPLYYAKHLFVNGTEITDLVIPESVTSIGKYAFYYCSNLTSVTIPSSVTSIGSMAFSSCLGLTTVNITDLAAWCGVEIAVSNSNPLYYAKHLFVDGTEITDLVIPESVTSIGKYAFYNCSNLTSVTIPSSVTNIGSYAFTGCSGLTSIIWNAVNCSSPSNSGGSPFYNVRTKITDFVIGKDVEAIPAYLCYGMNNLTSLTCNAISPLTCGTDCFGNIDKSIPLYVPCESVEAYKAADGWSDFTNIQPIEGTCVVTYTITFKNYDGTTLQESEVEEGELPSYTASTPTKASDAQYDYTFAGWTPEMASVTKDAIYTATYNQTIRSYVITWLDENGVELSQDSLEYGSMPSHADLTKDTSAQYTYTWKGWDNTVVAVTGDATYRSLGFIANLRSYTITFMNYDGTILMSGEKAYGEIPVYTGVTPVKPATADSVYYFTGWDKEIVAVTGDVTYTATFVGAGRNAIITYTAPWKQAEILRPYWRYEGFNVFVTNHLFENGVGTIIFSGDLESIGDTAFMYCSFTSITLPETVYSIGKECFINCSKLTSFNSPSSLRNIGEKAFSGCSALATISLPTSLENIGDYAFDGCSNITSSVDIPNKVTTIGNAVFRGCSGITSITLPNSLKRIGTSAFSGCSALATISLSTSLENIGDNAFRGCSGITSITLPNSLKRIGTSAFNGCSGVTSSIEIPDSVTSMGDSVFSNCPAITSIVIPKSVEVMGAEICENVPNLTTVVWNAANCFLEHIYCPFGYNSHQITNFTFGEEVVAIPYFLCAGMDNITSITIPQSVWSIGDAAFSMCSGLTSITCEATTPPTCGSSCFRDVNKSIPLYVPCESVDAYKAADGWSDFTNIQPIVGTCPTTYTITFVDEDSTLLQTEDILEGEYPWFYGDYPTKADDVDTVYTFAGWDKEVVVATEDVTYKATYTATAVADLHCVYFTNPNNWSSVGCYVWDNNGEIFGSWPGKSATKFGDVYRVVTPVGAIPNDNWMIIWNGDGSQTGDMKYVDGATYDMYGVVGGAKYCGPNLTWEFDEEAGLLSITGIGDTDEWGALASAPWHSISDSIRSVQLPNGMTSIGNYAFYYCSNLTSITCEATTPPTLGEDCFYNVDKSILLYVPCESVDAYKAADGWSDFTNILPIEGTCPTTYTITFKNYDGTTLQESEVEEGETPVYTGETPVKAEDADSTYTFAGWDKEIVAATTDATYTATYTATAKRTVIDEDIDVVPGQDYELGCNTTAGNITIAVNGGLEAADDCGTGSNPEAGDITVEVGEDGNAGSIIACENGLIADNLIISIPLKADTWYQLCFPFDVLLSDLNFGAGVEYLIRHYNGNERALNGKGGWKNGVGGGVKMHAFKGYAVAVSANTTLTVTIPTPNFTCEISNYILEVATSAINALHSSWNFMGNPFPCYYNIKDLFTGGENDHLTSTLYIYDPTIDDYIVKRLGADGDDYILYPYQAFFVQNPDNEPLEINWQAAGRLTAKMIADMAAHAPARAPRSVDSSRAFVELTLAAEGMRADETRIVFNEQASTDYEIRGDAMKMAGSAPIRLYTWDNLTGYAINERPSGEVNLGFSVRQEGDYTLSAKRMDTDIRLYDNLLHQTVDLNWGDYTFYTVAGTDNNRFTIYRAPQTTTAVEDIVTNLMSEDVTIYTVVGQLLYQDVRLGDITLPTGTYLIHAASETVKYVVY